MRETENGISGKLMFFPEKKKHTYTHKQKVLQTLKLSNNNQQKRIVFFLICAVETGDLVPFSKSTILNYSNLPCSEISVPMKFLSLQFYLLKFTIAQPYQVQDCFLLLLRNNLHI